MNLTFRAYLSTMGPSNLEEFATPKVPPKFNKPYYPKGMKKPHDCVETSSSCKSSKVFSEVETETVTETNCEPVDTTKPGNKKCKNARKAKKTKKAEELSRVSKDITQMLFGSSIPIPEAIGKTSATQDFLSDLALTVDPPKTKVKFDSKTFAQAASNVLEKQKQHPKFQPHTHERENTERVHKKNQYPIKPESGLVTEPFLKDCPEPSKKASSPSKVSVKALISEWETQGRNRKKDTLFKISAERELARIQLPQKYCPKAWTKASASSRRPVQKDSFPALVDKDNITINQLPKSSHFIGTNQMPPLKDTEQSTAANTVKVRNSNDNKRSGKNIEIDKEGFQLVKGKHSRSYRSPVSTPMTTLDTLPEKVSSKDKVKVSRKGLNLESSGGQTLSNLMSLKFSTPSKGKNGTLVIPLGFRNKGPVKPKMSSFCKTFDNTNNQNKDISPSSKSLEKPIDISNENSPTINPNDEVKVKYTPEIDSDGFQLVGSRRYRPSTKTDITPKIQAVVPKPQRNQFEDTPLEWRKSSAIPRSSVVTKIILDFNKQCEKATGSQSLPKNSILHSSQKFPPLPKRTGRLVPPL